MTIERFAGYAILSAAVACHPSARAAAGQPYVVDFSGGWTHAGANGDKAILSIPADFIVRPLRNVAAGQEWLVRLKASPAPLSDECFAVRGGAAPAARRVAVSEWEKAPLTDHTITVAAPAAAAGVQAILYQGRQYRMSGQTFGKALLSRSQRWLAIVSDTPVGGAGARSNPLAPLAGGEPSNGQLFLDVYDTKTGQRKAGATSPFSGFSPRILFGQAFWVDDGAFLMPLNLLANRCFFFAPESE
jgi:hypothetical protein